MESTDSREKSTITVAGVLALLVVFGVLYVSSGAHRVATGSPSGRKQLMYDMDRACSDIRGTLWPDSGPPPEPIGAIEAAIARIPGLAEITRVAPFGEDFLITAELPSGAKLFYIVHMNERRTELVDDSKLRLVDRKLREIEREKNGQSRRGREGLERAEGSEPTASP